MEEMSNLIASEHSIVITSVPSSTILSSNSLLNHSSPSGLSANNDNNPTSTINFTPLHLSTSDLESDNDDVMHSHLSKTCHQQGANFVHIIKDSQSSPDQSPLTSPGLLSPGLHTPCDTIYTDTNTQMSLVEVSSKLNIGDEASVPVEDSSTIWGMVNADHAEGVNRDGFRKVRKSTRKSDASSCVHSETEEEIAGFDANGAISTSQFVFSKFGTDVPCMFSAASTDGNPNSAAVVSSLSSPTVSANVADSTSNTPPPQPSRTSESDGAVFLAPQPVKRVKVKKANESSLSVSYPRSAHGYELKILSQPEEQHRARYMTEGSRGAIKDQSGQGSPQIQLVGYNRTVTCQIFVGSDTGRVRPHGFYQACRVAGRNSTPCTERDIDGTTVIEVQLNPIDNMTASIDCVGILKLRNADVEQRIGMARSKKKSTRVRMVFRVAIPTTEGPTVIIQTASTPISCTQPAGQPEICKKSMSKCSASGGEELFIIGKNFLKQGAKVVFQERDPTNNDIFIWQQKADMDQEYFQQTHLICTVPAYKRPDVTEPVQVEIVVHCANRASDPVPFTYTPGNKEATPEIKCEETETIPMETDHCLPTPRNKIVSPVALAMNELFARASKESGGSAPSLLYSIPSLKDVLQSKSDTNSGRNELADTLGELQKLLQECGTPSSTVTTSVISQEPITVEPSEVLKQEQLNKANETVSFDSMTTNNLSYLANGETVSASNQQSPQISSSEDGQNSRLLEQKQSELFTPHDQEMTNEVNSAPSDHPIHHLEQIQQQHPFDSPHSFHHDQPSPAEPQQTYNDVVQTQDQQVISSSNNSSNVTSPLQRSASFDMIHQASQQASMSFQQQGSPYEQQIINSPPQQQQFDIDQEMQQSNNNTIQQQQQQQDTLSNFNLTTETEHEGQQNSMNLLGSIMSSNADGLPSNSPGSFSIADNNPVLSLVQSPISSCGNQSTSFAIASEATTPTFSFGGSSATPTATFTIGPANSQSFSYASNPIASSSVPFINATNTTEAKLSFVNNHSMPLQNDIKVTKPIDLISTVESLQEQKNLQTEVVSKLASSLQQKSDNDDNKGSSVDIYNSLQELIGLMKVQCSHLSQLTQTQQTPALKEEPVTQEIPQKSPQQTTQQPTQQMIHQILPMSGPLQTVSSQQVIARGSHSVTTTSPASAGITNIQQILQQQGFQLVTTGGVRPATSTARILSSADTIKLVRQQQQQQQAIAGQQVMDISQLATLQQAKLIPNTSTNGIQPQSIILAPQQQQPTVAVIQVNRVLGNQLPSSSHQ